MKHEMISYHIGYKSSSDINPSRSGKVLWKEPGCFSFIEQALLFSTIAI